MKLIYLLIFFLSYPAFSCKLTAPLVSLSGPTTMLLEKLNLLEDKNLYAISDTHSIEGKITPKVIKGGIFVSRKTIESFKEARIIFDKSLELKRVIKKSGHTNFRELDTRDLDPFEAYNNIFLVLAPLLENCGDRIISLEDEIKSLRTKLVKKIPYKKAIFFLGKITDRKLPQLIISNDGIVLFYKKNRNFRTYESKLSYTPWSAKEMVRYKDYLKIGIVQDQSFKKIRKEVISKNKFNLYLKGALIPGLNQIELLHEIANIK